MQTPAFFDTVPAIVVADPLGVRVDMTFGAALPNTVTVVAYAEFENIIEIDRNRNVVFDFNN